MELISVIIPVYNVEKYLEQCVDSVINQTYRNIEIILINDGSTDNSSNICDEYLNIDSRIKVIHKKNEGVSSARNRGIEEANGKYIIFIDGDDNIEKNMIFDMYDNAIKYNTDIVRCNYFIDTVNEIKVNKMKTINIGLVDNKSKKEKMIIDIINGKIETYTCILFIRKEIIKSKFDVSLFYMEYMVFYLELINDANSIYIYDKPLYHYRYNVNSITKVYTEEKVIKKINQIALVYEKIESLILCNYSINEINIIQNFCNKILYMIYMAYNNDKKISIKNIMEQIEEKPRHLIKKYKIKGSPIYISIQIMALKLHGYFILKMIFKLKNILKKIYNKFIKNK